MLLAKSVPKGLKTGVTNGNDSVGTGGMGGGGVGGLGGAGAGGFVGLAQSKPMQPLVKLRVLYVCCLVTAGEALFAKQHPCSWQLPGRRIGVKHHAVQALSAQQCCSHSSIVPTSNVGRLPPAMLWMDTPSSLRESHFAIAGAAELLSASASRSSSGSRAGRIVRELARQMLPGGAVVQRGAGRSPVGVVRERRQRRSCCRRQQQRQEIDCILLHAAAMHIIHLPSAAQLRSKEGFRS